MNAKEKIITMLQENTGKSILDSGGAYGRHWERNQTITNFDSLPELETECFQDQDGNINELMFTLNVYHFLNAFLEVNETTEHLNNILSGYLEDKTGLEAMEDFLQDYNEGGYLTEGNGITNTYNGENLLSQDLQFALFTYEGKSFIILQIHNGCDVRGGYTNPVIFQLEEIEYFLMSMQDVEAFEENSNNNWVSDDTGYHWMYDGSSDDRLPLFSVLAYDSEKAIFYNKNTGNEIHFNCRLQF